MHSWKGATQGTIPNTRKQLHDHRVERSVFKHWYWVTILAAIFWTWRYDIFVNLIKMSKGLWSALVENPPLKRCFWISRRVAIGGVYIRNCRKWRYNWQGLMQLGFGDAGFSTIASVMTLAPLLIGNCNIAARRFWANVAYNCGSYQLLIRFNIKHNAAHPGKTWDVIVVWMILRGMYYSSFDW